MNRFERAAAKLEQETGVTVRYYGPDETHGGRYVVGDGIDDSMYFVYGSRIRDARKVALHFAARRRKAERAADERRRGRELRERINATIGQPVRVGDVAPGPKKNTLAE